MAGQEHADLRRVFEAALEAPAGERGAVLDRECGGNLELRKRVAAMVAAAEGEFLGEATMGVMSGAAPTMKSSERVGGEGVGTRIGPYKLLQLIGEGGFGSVFMAEQEKPVQRKVALKIIKLGMDTKAVIARFEAERQALALMDHPHIARVLDVGATETGRPYFVMDLVKGDPIAEYCDKNNLSIEDRLRLFAQVCLAVQHAHQKGIIHRDIKPSNILVSTQDGRPAAKVIDFGIAKATASKLTEKTLFTEHRQLIGTPEYMSPEQAEGSMDIDTRTDVYSLGVLLYELLTGSTPFSGSDMRSAAYGEIQRIIREVDPPKPSTRLSESAETIASVAARRHTEPKKLGMIVRGELDWIVMKALEKDRARRYESANGLAADIQRYLAGEAVVAAPPSAVYRIKKFARRHRGPVMAGAAVGTALLVGVVAFAWQAQAAREQRDVALRAQRAEAQQRMAAEEAKRAADAQRAVAVQEAARATAVNGFVERMFLSVDPEQVGGEGARGVTVLEMLSKASANLAESLKDQPQTESAARTLLGNSFRSLGRMKEAAAELERALELRSSGPDANTYRHAETLRAWGLVQQERGEEKEALRSFERARDMLAPLGAERAAEVVGSLVDVARTRVHLSQFAEGEAALNESAEVLKKSGRVDPGLEADIAAIASELAGAKGDAEKAEAFVADEVALRRKARQGAVLAGSLNNLAVMKVNRGKLDEALPLYDEAIEIAKREYGEKHHLTASFMENEANIFRMKKEYEKCEALMGQVLAIREAMFGAGSLPAAKTKLNIGAIAITRKDYKRGLELTDAVMPTLKERLGEKSMEVAQAIRSRALCEKGMGDLEGALRDNQAALVIYDAIGGPTAAVRLRTVLAIAELQCTLGQGAAGEATIDAAIRALDAGNAEQAKWIKSFEEQRVKCREASLGADKK